MAHLGRQTLTPSRAITQLRACRPIPENQVRELCYKARELLIEEGNVVGVDAPVTVRYYMRILRATLMPASF